MNLSSVIFGILAAAVLAVSILLVGAVVLILLVVANLFYVAICEAVRWVVTRMRDHGQHELKT